LSPIPKTPLLAVDTVLHNENQVLLIKRGHPPYLGKWALPGGFVEIGETVEAAAVRETWEETGLSVKLTGLLGVYSRPDRDPRGHTVSVVFTGVPSCGTLQAGSDAAAAEWVSIDLIRPQDIAFDHAVILTDAGCVLLK